MARNPWIAIHKQHTDRAEQALVDQEFESTEIYNDTCGKCGSPAFYRATVGAVQCPKCRSLLIVRVDQQTGKTTEYWSS